jgi:hypothetical protein
VLEEVPNAGDDLDRRDPIAPAIGMKIVLAAVDDVLVSASEVYVLVEN